jgi:hypothetical protein
MPGDLQKLAKAVLARNQVGKRDTSWDSRARHMSQSVKVAGTAKTKINQGDDPGVPLSHSLGLGQWDSPQILGHHLGHQLGQSPDSATDANMPVGDMAQTECDPKPYASALAALCAKCPAHVTEDRWHQAVADATAFATKWGAQAHTLGWTTHELLALHPVPEQPAPNYDRLARLDDMGLLWLLRGRPVVELTSMEAVIRCHSGATVKFYRPTEPVPPMEITNRAPAMDVGHADRHDHCRPRLAAQVANAGKPQMQT